MSVVIARQENFVNEVVRATRLNESILLIINDFSHFKELLMVLLEKAFELEFG